MWQRSYSFPYNAPLLQRAPKLLHAYKHGEVVFELIRRIASQQDTVLHVLVASPLERACALAIGVLLLYGRPDDRVSIGCTE